MLLGKLRSSGWGQDLSRACGIRCLHGERAARLDAAGRTGLCRTRTGAVRASKNPRQRGLLTQGKQGGQKRGHGRRRRASSFPQHLRSLMPAIYALQQHCSHAALMTRARTWTTFALLVSRSCRGAAMWKRANIRAHLGKMRSTPLGHDVYVAGLGFVTHKSALMRQPPNGRQRSSGALAYASPTSPPPSGDIAWLAGTSGASPNACAQDCGALLG